MMVQRGKTAIPFAKSILLIILMVMGLLYLNSCVKQKQRALGREDKILVFAEPETYQAVEDALNKHIGRTIKTPQTEQYYYFQRYDADVFDKLRNRKNIMFISHLEVYSPITRLVKGMLADSLRRKLLADPDLYFAAYNVYADGQALLILLGKNPQDLRRRIENQGARIFRFFDTAQRRRQTRFLYRLGEQKDLEERFKQEHGFYFRVIHDFIVIKDDPQKHFLWLGRDYPFRWFTIYWEPLNAPASPDSLSQVMLKWTLGTLLPDVREHPGTTRRRDDWVGSYSAIRFDGLWEHKEEAKGGPFFSLIFYEPEHQRMVCITGLVFAPDRLKLPYLRQLEVMAMTYRGSPPEEN